MPIRQIEVDAKIYGADDENYGKDVHMRFLTGASIQEVMRALKQIPSIVGASLVKSNDTKSFYVTAELPKDVNMEEWCKEGHKSLDKESKGER